VSAVQVTITRVLAVANQGAVEWTWRERRRAETEEHSAEDAIIFEVLDGQIVYWREYFDTANF
jgi:limonene-1,2-epoxide hydrolase